MRIAYFDCFSGISGDMIIGALLDAGLNFGLLKEQLAKLPVHDYIISQEKVRRAGIHGIKFHVILTENKENSIAVRNHHHSAHFNLQHIKSLIEKTRLHEEIKQKSIQVFQRLAMAEAKVHDTSVEEVHFHEVGAIDSIIDIVGSVIGLYYLGVKKIFFSPIPTGKGYVKCEHGIFPVPAPATAELIKSQRLRPVNIEKELTTPTGAAIITTLGEGLSTLPEMKIKETGYGAGSSENPEVPNLLRIFIGDSIVDSESDEMWIVETNIDNMTGEMFGYLMEKLFEAGAVDVYFTSIQMKKGRPGMTVSALVSEFYLYQVEKAFFDHTTTFGIRKYKVVRRILVREIREVDCSLGKIKVKIGKFNEETKNIAPEYEDCKRIAEEKGIPLKQVYRIISEELYKITDF